MVCRSEGTGTRPGGNRDTTGLRGPGHGLRGPGHGLRGPGHDRSEGTGTRSEGTGHDRELHACSLVTGAREGSKERERF